MLGFLLFFGGLLAAVGRRPAQAGVSKRELEVQALALELREIVPDRMPKTEPDPPAGICTYGDSVTEVDRCYWIPMYLKTESKVDLRWGACIMDWSDDIGRYSNMPGWTRKIDDVAVWIANILAAGAGDVAKWLLDRICFRMKWKGVRSYKFPSDTQIQADVSTTVKYYAVDRRESGILLGSSPDFPANMPERSGLKRVWVAREDSGASPMTRSRSALVVFWPRQTEGGPVIQELLTRAAIRDMLRMDPKTTGSINAKQLARAATERSSWWLSRRNKATEEYR